MKNKLFLCIALFTAMAMSPTALAYDFSKAVSSGQTLYFSITDGNTVKVTFPGSSSNYPYGEMWDMPRPTGALTIPASVTYNGITYTVTAIGTDAFYG